jgi:hypothetical protein
VRKYLLGAKGKFYKANLHVHTTISDGALTPEQAKEAYKKQGYSILAYTDHEILVPHNDLTDEGFLAITSYEAHINERIDNSAFPFIRTYHLNFYAKDKDATISPCFNVGAIWLKHSLDYVTDEMRKVEYPLVYSTDCINDMIAKANNSGFLVCYNHPVWSLQSREDYVDLKGLWGVEVYNTECALAGYIDTEQPFTDLLRKGNAILPIASDDAHSLRSAFGGFTMIEAERLDYSSVLKSMEEGTMYASNGPLIKELYVENGNLSIRCSEVKEIFLTTERRWTRVAKGEDITFAEFDLTEYLQANKIYAHREPLYIRLTIVDKAGRKAWTRAYFDFEIDKN